MEATRISLTLTARDGSRERCIDVSLDLPANDPAPALGGADAPRDEIDITKIAMGSSRPRFERILADGSVATRDDEKHIVVRDNLLGLEWAVGYVTDGHVEWKQADESARACRVLGHEDWRLPTRFELCSIVDDSRKDPAADPLLFPGTKSDWHWTSSPWAGSPDDYAWNVGFSYGYAAYNGRDLNGFVRAVRSVARAGQ